MGLSLFREGGFEDAGAGAAEPFRVGKSECLRVAGGILLDREQSGRAAPFRENFADAMPRSFWSNHGDVHGGGRLDGVATNIEAMREHQRFPGCAMRRDRFAVELVLLRVGR